VSPWLLGCCRHLRGSCAAWRIPEQKVCSFSNICFISKSTVDLCEAFISAYSDKEVRIRQQYTDWEQNFVHRKCLWHRMCMTVLTGGTLYIVDGTLQINNGNWQAGLTHLSCYIDATYKLACTVVVWAAFQMARPLQTSWKKLPAVPPPLTFKHWACTETFL
jgi:hypothetical protein